MKLPVYESSVGAPNPPQFRGVVDTTSNAFSEIADGLVNYQQGRLKQMEEETKLEYYKADTAIRFELEDAHQKMIESIQNGGSYAGAEEKYQETYNSVLGKYGKVFSGDPLENEKAMADYSRIGLGHTIQLRNAISSRRKSDARQAYSLRKEQAASVFLENPQKAIEMLTGATAGLQSVGVVNGDGAKAEIAQFVKQNTANKIQYFAQNNPNDPKSVLEMIEAEKENLDVDTYLNIRGNVLNEIERQDTLKNAYDNVINGGADAKQSDVDLVFNSVLESGISADSPEFASSLIEISARTNKFPTQVEKQLESIIFLPSENITSEQAKTFANIAAISKEIPPSSMSKMSGASKAAIRFVNDSIESGIPVETAVKQASAAMTNLQDAEKAEKDLEKFKDKSLYKDGEDPFLSYADGTVVSRLFQTGGASLLPGEQAPVPDPRMRSLFENRAFIYSQMGKSKDAAIEAAYKDVAQVFQPYKEKIIKYAPSVTTGLSDGEFEENAIIKPLQKLGMFNDKYKYEIVSDSQTEKEFMSGEMTTYPIYVVNDMGVLDRVRDKDNKPLRTMPLKMKAFKPFFSAGPLLLTDEDQKKFKEGKLKPWIQF